jgi:predicted kinase
MTYTEMCGTQGDDIVSALRAVIAEASRRDRNEAETRHKIIDFVLHDFLAWPRNRVSVEERIQSGYADYVCKKASGDPLIIIEAKKEGKYFELPRAHNCEETSCFISVAKLISDEAIRSALDQVRKYCFDTGTEYACITNGHEWIFFKTFEKGKKWEQLQALVVRSLSFFEKEYTRAVNSFSYIAVTERSSLSALLTSGHPKDRSIFYPKDKINSYSHTINANRLAGMLRPVINYYFGVIGDDDTEFMDRCYVSHRDYENTTDGMRILIHDSLSPYFQDYGVQQLDDTGKGGRLGGRLTKNLKHGRKGEVLVLFGGKGSGKSTFIKRLLYHKPPRWLMQHAKIAIIDLLQVPQEQSVVRHTIWSTLVSKLDSERLLASDRVTLLNTLFADRYEIACRQELCGLPAASEAYNVKLNSLISEWKLDLSYCAKRLMEYWRLANNGLIVVIDNTDQFSSALQDFCFSSAQEISKELECVTVISMREERFHNSKIHGLLDAFQNAGFHISSPKPAEVFRKRLQYTASLLSNDRQRKRLLGDASEHMVRDSLTKPQNFIEGVCN